MNYSLYTTSELASLFWDFYKDVHGIRPRWVDSTDRDAIIAGLEALNRHMEWMKSTPEGLEQLREEGWAV